jgi:hypothetical protein
MEQLITLIAPYIPAACWPLILVIGLYFVINNQRKNTKDVRDKDSEEMKTKIALMENEIKRLKDLDLETKLAQILTDLQWLKERFKD